MRGRRWCFLHQERLPHRPEFGSPDDFRKTRAALGSVEVRSEKTTWNETKREEKKLFPGHHSSTADSTFLPFLFVHVISCYII